MWPTWGPPGSCRPQVRPMLAPWAQHLRNTPTPDPHLSLEHVPSFIHSQAPVWFNHTWCKKDKKKPKPFISCHFPWEKNCHRELTVTIVVTAPGPMITAQSRLGEVTAQSRRGHSSVTARSQLSHGENTAQLRHLQYDHGSVTARSQLNHGPGQGSVTAGCDYFGHRELTVSSRWAHSELTVSSHGGQFFSHGLVWFAGCWLG